MIFSPFSRTLRSWMVLTLFTVLSAALLSACSSETDDVGVVARVNGRPIYLSQLEYRHDLIRMDASGTYVPSVEVVREEYGRLLTDFIVMELVFQELEAEGIEVTEEELDAEENRIRADYPEDAFEQVLIEEYIDLATWREQLKYRLARKKFFQHVLRPKVSVDYTEAEEYYRQHIDEYRLPESVHVVVLLGQRQELVEEALKLYRSEKDVKAIKAKMPEVHVREMTVPRANLSATWRDILRDLPEHEASPVTEVRDGYEALILLEAIPSRVLDPSQAYPMIEERLLEKKLQAAFLEWVEDRLATADIRVSTHLTPLEYKAVVPDAQEPGTSLQAAPGQEEGMGMPLGEEENGALIHDDGQGMPLGEEENGGPTEEEPVPAEEEGQPAS